MRCRSCTALINISFFEASGERVEHQALICAPEWGDEKTLRAISGETVNRDLGWEDAHTVDNEVEIFLHREDGKWVIFIKRAEIRAPQDMEKLELDSLNVLSAEPGDGLKHVLTALSGESEDHVDDDFKTAGAEASKRVLKAGERITAPNKVGAFFVDCLKPKLNPDGLDLV